MRNVPGLANYVTKNVKDHSKDEMLPQEWNERQCRLVGRSEGFLTKSKDRLWQEQQAKWYPETVAIGVPHGEKNDADETQTVENKPVNRTPGVRSDRRFVGSSRLLRLIAAVPAGFRVGIQPLDGVRALQMANGWSVEDAARMKDNGDEELHDRSRVVCEQRSFPDAPTLPTHHSGPSS